MPDMIFSGTELLQKGYAQGKCSSVESRMWTKGNTRSEAVALEQSR
jgi:hypothetical protein